MAMSDEWTKALDAHQAGDLSTAYSICSALLDANSRHVGALNLLGAIALQLEQYPQALEFLDQALRLVATEPSAWVNRGVVLNKLGRAQDALASYRRAVEVAPEFAPAWFNLGTQQKELLDFDEAVRCLRRCVEVDPRYAAAHFNLANTLHNLKRFDEAIAQFDRAIELGPDDGEARKNRSFARLMVGDFSGGFEDFEWRWTTPPLNKAWRDRSCPQWDGQQSLERKTILVHAEQGLGDTLQFCRYLPIVKSLGAAQVVFEVQRPLLQLMRTVEGADIVVPQGLPLPAYDFHIPLMSMPRALGTTPSTIPAPIPYIGAQPERLKRWLPYLTAQSFKVGICWQGSAKGAEVGKGIPLSAFAPLSACPGVQLFCLQKLDDTAERPGDSVDFPLTAFGPEFDADTPFADTAAVMSDLDLVITTDTSIAHLAGAMGVPVWVALPYVCDWRWGPTSSRTAWYPTMRLFRQAERGSWVACFEEIRLALEAEARSKQTGVA